MQPEAVGILSLFLKSRYGRIPLCRLWYVRLGDNLPATINLKYRMVRLGPQDEVRMSCRMNMDASGWKVIASQMINRVQDGK